MVNVSHRERRRMAKLIYVDPERLEKIEHRRQIERKPYSLQDLISESENELIFAIRKSLGRLSRRERQVVRLLLKGRSVKEIAGKLSVSESSVYTIRERAVRNLRRIGCLF